MKFIQHVSHEAIVPILFGLITAVAVICAALFSAALQGKFKLVAERNKLNWKGIFRLGYLTLLVSGILSFITIKVADRPDPPEPCGAMETSDDYLRCTKHKVKSWKKKVSATCGSEMDHRERLIHPIKWHKQQTRCNESPEEKAERLARRAKRQRELATRERGEATFNCELMPQEPVCQLWEDEETRADIVNACFWEVSPSDFIFPFDLEMLPDEGCFTEEEMSKLHDKLNTPALRVDWGDGKHEQLTIKAVQEWILTLDVNHCKAINEGVNSVRCILHESASAEL